MAISGSAEAGRIRPPQVASFRSLAESGNGGRKFVVAVRFLKSTDAPTITALRTPLNNALLCHQLVMSPEQSIEVTVTFPVPCSSVRPTLGRARRQADSCHASSTTGRARFADSLRVNLPISLGVLVE